MRNGHRPNWLALGVVLYWIAWWAVAAFVGTVVANDAGVRDGRSFIATRYAVTEVPRWLYALSWAHFATVAPASVLLAEQVLWASEVRLAR